MKKEGFTLVELLAVIAILALLVVLTVPRVVKLFEESQDNLFREDAQSIYKAIENDILSLSIEKGGKKSDIIYSSTATNASKTVCTETTSHVAYNIREFQIQGIKDFVYFVRVENNRILDFRLCSEAYCVQMDTQTGNYSGFEELDPGYISDVRITDNDAAPIDVIFDPTETSSGYTCTPA